MEALLHWYLSQSDTHWLRSANLKGRGLCVNDDHTRTTKQNLELIRLPGTHRQRGYQARNSSSFFTVPKYRVKYKVCVWLRCSEHHFQNITFYFFLTYKNHNKVTCCCRCLNLRSFPPALPRLSPPATFSKQNPRTTYNLGSSPPLLTGSDWK